MLTYNDIKSRQAITKAIQAGRVQGSDLVRAAIRIAVMQREIGRDAASRYARALGVPASLLRRALQLVALTRLENI